MEKSTNSAKQPLCGALKMREARAYIGGVSIPTMYRLCARKLIRPNRSTRHLIFEIRELDRFLRDGQV
jgi:hypothetical protein